MSNRAVKIALSKQKHAEIVMGVGKIRPEIDRLPEMIERFVDSPDARENIADGIVNNCEAEIVMLVFAPGTDCQGALQVGQRLIQLTSVQKRISQIR